MTRTVDRPAAADLPDWVPDGARHYLGHIEQGRTIRQIAREANVHASTILRQVRRFEGRRDDPLVDDALRALSAGMRHDPAARGQQGEPEMTKSHPPADSDATSAGSDRMGRESLRVLRRLCEPQAVLAVARDMDMAVVVREVPDGAAQRTAVVDRDIAQAMALKEWILCADPTARVARYRITQLGRQELRRMAGEAAGFAEARTTFVGARGADEPDDRIRHMRSMLGESPLAALARRRDKDGSPFLSRDLVAAGERLREDFELAQVGPRVTQDWARFLTGPSQAPAEGALRDRGAAAARQRVADALADLGPGLGDVALRCCCFQEGLETLEKNMGWAARSGKVVLRIAMQRLQRHYAETGGKYGPMIG